MKKLVFVFALALAVAGCARESEVSTNGASPGVLKSSAQAPAGEVVELRLQPAPKAQVVEYFDFIRGSGASTEMSVRSSDAISQSDEAAARTRQLLREFKMARAQQ